jgi:hypothetical protein
VKQTARWMVALGLLLLLWTGGCLYVEVQRLGAGVPFTAAWRLLWAEEPWVVFLGSHLVAAVVWFLAGHFFGASQETYDDLRRRAARGEFR